MMTTQTTKTVGRFIHTWSEKTDLPTTWTYPHLDELAGAQTLDLARVFEIAQQDDDSRDDWFSEGHRQGHLALIEVTGFSGDSGPLKYRVITEKDVVAMHVISYDALDWELTEIAMELSDEGHGVELDEMGFPQDGWIDEVGEDVVADRLKDRMDKVEPTWVSRVPGHEDAA